MATKISPLADWVVAQQEEAVNKTASGLYLPDKAAEKPKTAKVLKVGTKVKEIKPGRYSNHKLCNGFKKFQWKE